MPQPASTTASTAPSRPTAPDETTTIDGDDDNDGSSISFLDVPTDEEDDDVFEDSRSHISPAGPTPATPEDVEYVVLYDNSDDEL